MATITINATSPFRGSADTGAPSALNVTISGSTDPQLPNGTYDAWCLDPRIGIDLDKNLTGTNYDGSALGSYTQVDLTHLTTEQVARLQWILAQDFTSNPNLSEHFNYGEVQVAIWKTLGHTIPEGNAELTRYLTNNGRHTVDDQDVARIETLAQNAYDTGAIDAAVNQYFTRVIDPDGKVQPLILQQRTAELGDYVWEDRDHDGVQDADESGVDGVTVNLLDSAGTIIKTVVTGDDPGTAGAQRGFYQFTGLRPGTYWIEFLKPGEFASFTTADADADSHDTVDSDANATGLSDAVTLKAGDVNRTIDAGLVRFATLGDRVWLDRDGDGEQDAGEAGIAGVRVLLCDGAGNPTGRTATTDSQGNYLFDNLTPGVYSVKFEAPTGHEFTRANATVDSVDSDADVLTGKTGNYLLDGGDSNLSVDAGLVQRARLGDRIWEDTDADGRQDSGEQGIANIKVHLKDADGNIIDSTTTDVDGLYGFNVLPGTYSIQIEKPAGYIVSPKDVGNNAADSDIDASTLASQQVTLASGDINLTLDGGLYRTAELGDRVWLDRNGNGIQDASEAGLGNVTVHLRNGSGTLIDTQRTDAQGNYLFTGLRPGTYSLEFEAPEGYIHTFRNIGDDTADSDASRVTGQTLSTVLTSGESDRTWDAGFFQKARLGDRVWEDANANGLQDDGEAGIGNVTVHLRNADGDIIQSTVTNAQGFYAFEVRPGTYSVSVVAPTGYHRTQKDAGTNDALDSDIDLATPTTAHVTLESGEKNLTLDAGLYRKAQLGDRVWLDDNGNGQQDDTEGGLAGVRVLLCDVAGNPTGRVATTGREGRYLFTDLTPGTYSVKFELPSGYTFTRTNIGIDGTDSDPDATTGKTGNYTLASGESNLTVDAGVLRRARLGDRVWEDRDADGQQDEGEQGIANVKVHLRNATGQIIASTSTDGNGLYGFNVAPGTYSVQIEKPTGYFLSTKNTGLDDAKDSDIDATTLASHTVTLQSGGIDLTLDGGLYRKASIGDRVWEDRDHDYNQDSTEPGVGNVKVSLQNSAGATLMQTHTDSNGYYLFADLDPGIYRIVFDKSATLYRGVDMSTWRWAKADIGGNDNIDADAFSTSDIAITAYTTLESGENDRSWDAGITPIIVDLNGDGVRTLARTASDATFDLIGNGTAIRSGWVSTQDGLLAVDSNRNGSIDSIHELFGGLNKGDGFARLQSYDSNADGWVDANDARFDELRIWQDADSDRITDGGELRTLAEAGIAALNAGFVEKPFIDAQVNLHLEQSSARLSDGTSVDMTDVYFNVSKEDAAQVGAELPDLAALIGDDRLMDDLVGTPASVRPEPPHPINQSHTGFYDSISDVARSLIAQLEQNAGSA